MLLQSVCLEQFPNNQVVEEPAAHCRDHNRPGRIISNKAIPNKAVNTAFRRLPACQPADLADLQPIPSESLALSLPCHGTASASIASAQRFG